VPSAWANYLDACATTPPAAEVLEAMAAVQAGAWANPSSLHGYGLAAAEQLERSRLRIGELLGCASQQVLFTSGGTESIHTALLGGANGIGPGRLLISAVEHPATLAAASQLQKRGWQVETVPVDNLGVINLERLEQWLVPPTRLVSLIWGQSEVGTIQPIEAIGSRCRRAGVLLHLDAVQVIGHRQINFNALPVDLLSLAGHKLQGPRGIGALLIRPDLPLQPLIGGGGQEAGRRGGTESVALVAGLCRALELCDERLRAHGGCDPSAPLRDALLNQLIQLEGTSLSGPDPRDPQAPPRLPHHLSLLVDGPDGQPLSGRRLVRALWRQGYAVSSGSACSSRQPSSQTGLAPSPILRAMGYADAKAASGVRFSLGPWHSNQDLAGVAAALQQARWDGSAARPP
jgi:cysteine desulfurase